MEGNVTGLHQQVARVHAPKSVGEVRAVVRDARARGAFLYPVSTGLNWGYGSASPPRAGAELLDLSGLNAILNADRISESNPVAVIQPGVTQGQLADFLAERCPSLTFNVTGSARATSVLGNALDRGVGYEGPRYPDLFGLEIVTGTGELISTGFRRLGEDSPLAHCHPAGTGPILDGLFLQGNSGIVTSACFRLRPRRARQVAVTLAVRPGVGLGALIDTLAGLKREQVLSTVMHIGNPLRGRVSLMHGVASYLQEQCGVSAEGLMPLAEQVVASVAAGEWVGLGGVAGTERQVAAALHEIRRRVRAVATMRVFDERRLALGYRVMHSLRFLPWARNQAAAINAIRPLHGLALGRPTDAAIDNLLWRFGRADLPAARLDESNCGLIFINPALPMDGRFVERALQALEAVAAQHGHVLYTTVNLETENSLVAVINLLFDRSDPAACAQAKRCADAIYAEIRRLGLEVYRARADMMGQVVDAASPYWQAIARVKKSFDPDGVIAPGRYCP
ncbi:MAG: FAD-binding oxidoreductase [Paucibacter sp.]|nr:FAD-binding oxidoreductase [Roseateles sp.]